MAKSVFTSILITASALFLIGTAATSHAQNTIYGIGGTANGTTGVVSSLSLFSFSSATPGTINSVGAITGIASGYTLQAIDFRPATGQLYGLAYNGTNTAQLYTLNLTNAQATSVGSTFNIGSTSGGIGSSIGIGFNPSVDLLRVVTGTNGNFRINPTTGAIVTTGGVDGGLAYGAGDPNANNSYQIADGDYTTDARLFDVDYINNVLARQNPPNNGTLVTVGSFGITQVNGPGAVGFDIDSANLGYLSTSLDTDTGFQSRLLTVNLATGAANSVGLIGTGVNFETVDISVQVVPEPSTYALLGGGTLTMLAAAGWRRRQQQRAGLAA